MNIAHEYTRPEIAHEYTRRIRDSYIHVDRLTVYYRLYPLGCLTSRIRLIFMGDYTLPNKNHLITMWYHVQCSIK